MAYQIGDYLARHNLKRIALISVASGFGKAGRRELLTQAPDFGVTLVSDQVSPDWQLKPEEADQLVRASLQSRPQALVIWSAVGAVELTLAARRQGISIPLLHSGGIAGPEFLQACGEAANGVLFPQVPCWCPNRCPKTTPKSPLSSSSLAFVTNIISPLATSAATAWMPPTCWSKRNSCGRPQPGQDRRLPGKPAGAAGRFRDSTHFSPVDHNGLTHESFLMIQIEQGRWRPAPE